MANSDRDIVISPDRGASTDPTIRFTGADSLSSATIVLRVYNSGTDATLSFEGDVGQLLAITDSTLGSVFSVNDITGIPSIEVLDTGEIKLAQYSGFVNIPNSTNATSTGTGALRTLGGVGIARDVWVGGNVNIAGTLNAATVVGSVTTASQVVITNDNASATAHYLTFVSGTSGNLPIKVDSSALTFVPSTNNVGIGTTNPYTRLSIVSSANTEGTSYFTSAYEASRQWGTRIWKNDIGGGIPLQIETQYATTWYNSIRIGHGQDNSHPSLTTFYTTHLATTGGNVGIGDTSPTQKLVVSGSAVITGGVYGAKTGAPDATIWAISGDYTNWGLFYNEGNPDYIEYKSGGTVTSRIALDTGEANFGLNGGNVGINTTDYSYSTGDNTRIIGAYTNNKLFVNGSIQLLGNNDAIVIGRGTATFLTDEELGFGWGGGWWMNDSTYLRVRNYKHLYNENTITGSRHQGFSTDYNQPSMFMPRWEDTNWAFGMSSNNSNTYWMQVQYNGANNNTRGFRVWDNNASVARMSVADRITTHQNTFYRTFQNYTGSDNGPVKTWDGVLIAGSDYSGAQAYTIIDTGVPQDSYMMGGFTIEWFENYGNTNAKTTIKLGGYWNPESNGGFIGWEYTTSNPNIVPTIQVCRNNSTGNTAFVLTHFNSSYAIILARDLWLGYSGGDYNYGHGWAIRQQGDLAGYSNFDTVVARAAASASGINADTLDGFDSTRFLRSVGHPGYGDWNTFGNNNPQTVMQMFQENFNLGSNTGSSNFPSPNYPYGTLINFDANSSARAQMYISHAGPDLHFRGGWGTGSWQTWHKTWNTGNDGAGSGLDADLLDGLDSTIVMRPVAAYKWDVSSNGATGRRYTIMRLYGTPNHWGSWQNIEITLTNTYFNGGYVKYYLYGYYGMGNGSSWILQVKDAGGVGTGYMRVNLGTVTYAGFTSGGQNTYYQDVYVDMDYYTSAKVTVEFYGHGYQTTTPGAESYTLTQLYTSPATTNITYSNDDKSSSYIFGNKIWNAGNDGAGSGLDADLLDGLELHTGRNNEANKVVRTDGNGYIQAGWINTTSGDLGNPLPDRVYMSNDGYIRYNTLNTAKAHLGNTAKYGNSRPNITGDTNYWVGSMGWGTTDLNSIFDWGSGFWDSWSSPGNQPSGATSHWTGLQAMHYTNGTNRYGYQLTMGAGDPNLFYVRGVWGGSPSSWYKVNLLGLNQGSISNFASIYYDSDDTAFYVDPANGGFNLRGGSSNRVTYFTDDSGYKVSNAEGTGIQMRLGAAWSRAGIYSNSYLDLGAESTIAWRIANSEKGYMDSSSNLIAYGSMRAPIFYDYNNTSYYVDPAATGVVANFNTGSINFASNNTSGTTNTRINLRGAFFQNEYYRIWANDGANISSIRMGWDGTDGVIQFGEFYQGGNRWTTWPIEARPSGSGGSFRVTSGDMRAPIFYDQNNTSYYLDPGAGKSLRIAGGVAQENLVGRPYAVWGSTSATGPVVIKFPGGTGNYGMIHAVIDVYEYNGNAAATIRVGGHNWNGAWYNFNAEVIGQTDKPVRVGVKDGRYCIIIGNSSSSWSYGQVVLRKIQNGSYYSGIMEVAEGYTVAIESDTYTYVSGDLRNLRTPLSFTAGTDVRAPIYYDSNNTGYYLDPNATTALRTVGSWRADSASWDGDFSGKIQYHSNHWYFQAADLFLFRNSGGSNVAYFNQSGHLYAPVMYDINNSGYYTDPASGSRFYDLTIQSTIAFPTSNGASQGRGGPAYNIYQEAGAWNYPYPDLNIAFHTGLSFGANPSYDGMRFYTDYDLSSRVMQVNGSSNYIYMDRWVNVAGHQGIYSSTNSAHFYPNNGSYGAWRIDGTRNGWHGIYAASGSTLMMNDGDGGLYRESVGWRFYHSGGNFYAPGDIIAYWSDRRLKDNIVPLVRGQGLEIISQLQPSRFTWKTDVKELHPNLEVEPGAEETSLIAQEVQEVLPIAVAENKSGRSPGKDSDKASYLTVKYDKITPFLIQAVKDLMAEINDLKSEIKDLKEKLNNGAN